MKDSTEALIAKLTGAGLIGMSTVFFIAISSGARAPGILLLPALAFGVSGLWMLVRRERRDAPLSEPSKHEIDALRDAVVQLQIELDGTQTQVERLIEERVFIERLLKERSSVELPR